LGLLCVILISLTISCESAPEGAVDISKMTRIERIQDALIIANKFLSAIHNDHIEEAYDLLVPAYHEHILLEDFKKCVNKENFIKEVKKEYFAKGDLEGSYLSSGYDDIWFNGSLS